MEISRLHSDKFNKALADYFYLIDHDYPEKGSLKLVGDRYQLETDLRNVLYRSISSSVKNKTRSQRLIQNPIEPLIIDGYNVILTLLNYRLGKFVFISTDDICRDAGALFGKFGNNPLFSQCAELMVKYLSAFEHPDIKIYLDSPVSYSLKHKQLLLALFQKKMMNIQVEVVHSADHAIKENSGGTVATSDSVIIDACNNPIIDLPRLILQKEYDASLLDIGLKLKEILLSHQ
jgi:hypothetical protein